MSTIDTIALTILRVSLSPSATVALPEDPGYSVSRWARNAEKPASLVACPATNGDVVQLVAFAQGKAPYSSQERLHLAIKGGGHNAAGASSSDGGLVIDLEPHMRQVRVDPEAKLAYVQGGCLWRDVDQATFPFGLASVSGVVSHTGVGGLALGGGFGWLSGEHGLVIDNLLQATIITSDGEVLTVNRSNNVDLFWALRGGGGNFGVVTEFVLKLHEQRSDLYSSLMVFPHPMLENVVTELNRWIAEHSPREMVHLVFALGPNELPVLILQFIYNGDSREGATKLAHFAKLEPIVNTSETIPYLKLNTMSDIPTKHGDFRLLHGNYVPIVPGGLPIGLVSRCFDQWLKFVTDNPVASRSTVTIEIYHPAKWTSVPPDATAYFHRSSTYNILYLPHWTDPSFTEHAANAVASLDQAFIEARDEFIGRGVTGNGGYTNYMDHSNRTTGITWLKHRFEGNYLRLIGVKKRYDPIGLFGRWFIEPKDL